MTKRGRKSAKPYKGRKGPNISATECKIGIRKRGNDCKMWVVKSYARPDIGRRVKRWVHVN